MPRSLQAGVATPREPSPRVRINSHSLPALSVIIADLHTRQRTGVIGQRSRWAKREEGLLLAALRVLVNIACRSRSWAAQFLNRGCEHNVNQLTIVNSLMVAELSNKTGAITCQALP